MNQESVTETTAPVGDWRGVPVLVTGATGFTGTVLTRELVARGADVRAIARPSSRLDDLSDLPVRWFRGEIYDPATVADAVRDVHYVFHLAAAFRYRAATEEGYRRVHLEGTQRLAEAALKTPGFRRFLHVSTIGVHGHIEGGPIDENGPFSPGDGYQRTKLEGELWIRDFAARERLPYCVIRPAAIYGLGDRRLLKFFKMASRPVLFLVGRGQCLYHLIHVEDLVQGILLGAIHPAALNEVFICGNSESIPLVDFARVVAGEIGNRFRVLRLPATPFFLAADVCTWICDRLRLPSPLYRRRVAFFTKDRCFDTRKIRDQLGFRQRYGNAEGIRATTRWYLDHQWLKQRRRP